MQKPQVQFDMYSKLEYNTKLRFLAYWYQINQVLSLAPKNILEIGVGNKFFIDYCKKLKINITSVDFDPQLEPDVVASVLDLPFEDNSFDLVACFEVLEHLPFEQLPKAIGQIARITQRFVVLSLPDAKRCIKLYIKVPKIERQIFLPLPFLKKTHRFDGQHYWELNTKHISESNIIEIAQRSGLKLKSDLRPFDCPEFHFFVFEKSA